MVNTRTDAELAAAVQAAVDAMLPQIREQVREEYRAGASGGNPLPATIHTWLKRFSKQKPHSFEKAVAPAKGGDAWVLTLTWAAFKELFFLQFFPRAEQERLKREYHSIRQRASENSTEYMQRFLRLAGFLDRAWTSVIQFTDVAQVADVARNLEILRDRDDYDRSERSDKRHKSGDRYHPYSQQGSHKSHGQSDDRQRSDRQGSDRQSGGSNYRRIMTAMDPTGRAVVVTTATTTTTTTTITTTLAATTGILVLDANKGIEASNPTDLPTRVPSSPGYPLRVILTLFATHVDVDTQESVVVLLVLASNVARLVIFSGTARRTLVLV
ncbi:zinc finger, CCHC-type, retrotransposon gag domain protein, partial [Tanacetum coccineum]